MRALFGLALFALAGCDRVHEQFQNNLAPKSSLGEYQAKRAEALGRVQVQIFPYDEGSRIIFEHPANRGIYVAGYDGRGLTIDSGGLISLANRPPGSFELLGNTGTGKPIGQFRDGNQTVLAELAAEVGGWRFSRAIETLSGSASYDRYDGRPGEIFGAILNGAPGGTHPGFHFDGSNVHKYNPLFAEPSSNAYLRGISAGFPVGRSTQHSRRQLVQPTIWSESGAPAVFCDLPETRNTNFVKVIQYPAENGNGVGVFERHDTGEFIFCSPTQGIVLQRQLSPDSKLRAHILFQGRDGALLLGLNRSLHRSPEYKKFIRWDMSKEPKEIEIQGANITSISVDLDDGYIGYGSNENGNGYFVIDKSGGTSPAGF